jgi:hypothetical protein
MLSDNSIIAQAEKRVEALIPAQQREAYFKIVIAGNKILMQGGPQSPLASLKTEEDPITALVHGVVGILQILRHMSNGTMPVPIAIAAGMTLVLQGLDFMDRTGIQKIGNQEIDATVQLYNDVALPAMGVKAADQQAIASQGLGALHDPSTAAKVQHVMGVNSAAA